MKEITRTERLILREFSLDDAPFLFELNQDPIVLKYTGDVPFSTLEDARFFLETYSEYKRSGFGRWSVVLKETGECIGWCGLKRNEENLIDLGFRFFQKHWNKGYATEAAQAALDTGFNQFELKEIIGRVAKENPASMRVLEKIGMTQYSIGECHGIPDAIYYRALKIEQKSKS